MKLTCLALTVLAIAATAFAEAPPWGTDVSKTISAARTEKKLVFILAGREACGNCQATKRMIGEGTIITATDFVAADINVDDQKAFGEFERKYKKEKLTGTLPFVVIADSNGKALASYSGMKGADALKTLIEDAKKKVAAAPKR